MTASGSFIDVPCPGGTYRAWLTCPASGSGPGVVLLQEIFGLNDFMRDLALRLAEEGYVCIVPDMFWRQEPGVSLGLDELERAMNLRANFDPEQGLADIDAGISVLRNHPAQCGRIAAVGFCMGGMLAALSAARGTVDCAVAYYPTGMEEQAMKLADIQCPVVFHFGENDDKVPAQTRATVAEALGQGANAKIFTYPECQHGFANHHRAVFDKPAAMMAYSRTLALLRSNMGPIFDLSELWDKHTEYEFATRDVDATMATMVEQPYVNHVPTMTGGVGHDHLKRFYKYHFVNSNPPDTRLIPVSRTVGVDRLVDEMIFCFTHTCEIPWMLPGIEPTDRYVEIPLVAVVNFRGEKLYHEHIYWDQASVLVQIGLLDASSLPVAGIETAKKLVDETLPSNELMAAGWADSEGQPL